MNGDNWNAAASWVGIIVAGLIGFWGVWTARKANGHAADALELAKSAEARAGRLEQIAIESRDVDWSWSWVDETDVLSIRNIGTDTAYDVELVVDVDGYERRVSRLPVIDATDAIGIKLTQIRVEADREWRELLNAGAIGNTGFSANVRVTWRSESAVPGIKSWDDVPLG